MLITKASEYALLSLIVIAKEKKPVNTDVLSKRLDMSRSFLAKILQLLAKEKILTSYKGSNGGFRLSCKPSEISILEIMNIVENNKPIVSQCSKNSSPCSRFSFNQECSIWEVLRKLQFKIELFLQEISLESLLSTQI